MKAHRALSCSGYSRSDFIISAKGPIYLETNTLPGLTKASLYPKALKAQGIEFADFLQDQIVLSIKTHAKVVWKPGLGGWPEGSVKRDDCVANPSHSISNRRLHPSDLPFVYQ